MIISINFGEKGTVYGCGHSLDTLLFAHDLFTESDLHDNAINYENEALEYAFKQYDFAELLRKQMNVADSEFYEHELGVTLSREYLAGDALYFDHRELFNKLANEKEERARKMFDDGEYTDYTGLEFVELAKELREARDWYWENAQKEWIHGDRSEPGVLKQLSESMFGRSSDAEISWNSETDTVEIDASEKEWREYMGYVLDEDEPLPTAEALAEFVKKDVINQCEAHKKKLEAKAAERAAERARLQAREQAQLEREKEEARNLAKQKALANS